jgi:hypothetical protein
MLKKLIKHEFKATAKTMGLLFGAVLLLSVLTSISLKLPEGNKFFDTIKAVLIAVYVVVMFGMMFAGILLLIFRFYNNMLKDQGYLTHTLPVKMWQHIVAKMLTYFVWIVAAVVVAAVSLGIFLMGTGVVDFSQIGEAISQFGAALEEYPEFINMSIWILVLGILQIFANILCMFASMSMGQLFGKHRVAGSVASYIGLNYIIGIFTSFIMYLPMNSFEGQINALDEATNIPDMIQIFQNMLNGFFVITLVVELVLIALYFGITHFMLTRKLNLE